MAWVQKDGIRRNFHSNLPAFDDHLLIDFESTFRGEAA